MGGDEGPTGKAETSEGGKETQIDTEMKRKSEGRREGMGRDAQEEERE